MNSLPNTISNTAQFTSSQFKSASMRVKATLVIVMCFIFGTYCRFYIARKAIPFCFLVVNSLDSIGEKLTKDPISAAVIGKFFIKNVVHDLLSPKKE